MPPFTYAFQSLISIDQLCGNLTLAGFMYILQSLTLLIKIEKNRNRNTNISKEKRKKKAPLYLPQWNSSQFNVTGGRWIWRRACLQNNNVHVFSTHNAHRLNMYGMWRSLHAVHFEYCYLWLCSLPTRSTFSSSISSHGKRFSDTLTIWRNPSHSH